MLCSSVVRTISLSPSRIGRAKSKPVIYCELTFPATLYFPLFNFPSIKRGSSLFEIHFTPCSGKIFKYSPIGLFKSVPEPVIVTFLPNAAATGIINFEVFPDSIQSNVSSSLLIDSITCFIACISFDSIIGLTSPPPAKKEHNIAL